MNWGIVSYFNNNSNYIWSGYEGYIDCQEIPKGD